MSINGYFGVRSLEAVMDGLKSMDSKAQIALFLGAGIAVYGYFKYGRKERTLKIWYMHRKIVDTLL